MSNEKLDPAGVQQKFGVAPEQIVDYLALTGDAVDNVPGVEKVGPKTAAKWIQQYGSLDEVMAHAGEIPGAVGENLRKALDWLPKGRELLTVKRDVALPVGLGDLGAQGRRRGEAGGILRALRHEDHAARDPGQCARAGRARRPRRRRASAAEPRERRKYLTLHDEADLAGFLREARSGRAGRLRHRDHRPRADDGATGRHVVRLRRHGLVPAARARLSRRAGPDRRREGAGDAQALAGKRAPREGRPEPEVRRAHPRQPRHAPRRHRARHAARILRLRSARAPRPGLAGAAAPGLEDHHLRRSHRQGRVAHRLLRGRDRARHRIRRRGRGLHPERARRPVREDLRGRETEVRLREDRNAGDAGAAAHGAQRRADRRRQAGGAEPRARQGDAGDRAEGLPGGRPAVQPRIRPSRSRKSCSSGRSCR